MTGVINFDLRNLDGCSLPDCVFCGASIGEMIQRFSTSPKLVCWVPSAQQIKTIKEARRRLDLVLEEKDDATNALRINTLNVVGRRGF